VKTFVRMAIGAAILGSGLAVAAGGGTPVASSAAQRAIGRLEALGRAFRARPVWTASYRQEFIPAGMKAGESASGAVWIAWPDRALFMTTQPAKRNMALEGRVVRLIDMELETCEEHVLDDREWERIPLVAVLDPRHALDRFRVTLDGKGRLTLKPLEPGGVARVEVDVGQSGLPSEVTVVDIQGAVNHLWFTEWAPAGGPPGGRWMPEPPAGIECQRDGHGTGGR